MLQVGLATVAGLGLKGSWRSDLTSKAGTSWSNYKKVPNKKK